MSVISLMFKEKWLLQKHFRKIIFGIFLLLPLGYFLLLENNVTDIHIVHLVERVMFEKKCVCIEAFPPGKSSNSHKTKQELTLSVQSQVQ